MHAHLIDEFAVKVWIDAYGAAWVARDAEALVRLFAADACYQQRRDEPALRGTDAIRNYWRVMFGQQRDIMFEATVVALRGYTACVHWHASFSSVTSGELTELDALSRVAFSVECGSEGLPVAYAWDEWIDEAGTAGPAPRRTLPAV